MPENLTLVNPYNSEELHDGDIIRINRFDTTEWTVHYGWFAFSGNREICGWYLVNNANQEVRPLQKIDCNDIYFVEKAV